MPTQPAESKPQPPSEPRPEEKRPRLLLGMAVGVGALVVILVFSALIGGALYYWFLRVPQATLAPQAPQVEEGAPPAGLPPTQSAPQVPDETAPPPAEATLAVPEATPLQPAPGTSYEVVVIVEAINVRTGPGTRYPVIITYPEGTRMLAVGRNEDASWFVVQLTATQQGWISVPLVSYDFDRYTLPVIPAPPLPENTPSPYGSAVLVPPELSGSQPLAPILPLKRMVSLASLSLFGVLATYLERLRLIHLAKVSLRQVLVLGAHLFLH